MAAIEGVVVDIVCLPSGQPYELLDSDESIRRTGNRRRFWNVPVKAGQQFGIRISIDQDFDWGHEGTKAGDIDINAIQVNLGFDIGQVIHSRDVFILRNTELAAGLARDTDLGIFSPVHGSMVYTIDHVWLPSADFNAPSGAARCTFRFRKLEPDKQVRPRTKSRQDDGQGKIRVEARRAIITPDKRARNTLPYEQMEQGKRASRESLIAAGITLETETVRKNDKMGYRRSFKAKPCTTPGFDQQYNWDFKYRERAELPETIPQTEIDEVWGAKVAFHQQGRRQSTPLLMHIQRNQVLGDDTGNAAGSPRTSESDDTVVGPLTVEQLVVVEQSATNESSMTDKPCGDVLLRLIGLATVEAEFSWSREAVERQAIKKIERKIAKIVEAESMTPDQRILNRLASKKAALQKSSRVRQMALRQLAMSNEQTVRACTELLTALQRQRLQRL